MSIKNERTAFSQDSDTQPDAETEFHVVSAGLQQCLYRLLPLHWQSLHKVCQCVGLKTRGGNTAPCHF